MQKIGICLPVIAGVMWGSVGICVRKFSDYGMDGVAILESKMAAAALIFIAVIFIYNNKWLCIRAKDIWMFILTGLAGMMMLNICYNEAAIRLTLSFAAVLLSLSPVFVMFMAALVFKEKITRRKAGCTFIALIGCILVSGAVDNHNSINMTSSGVAIGLMAAFFYALYSILSNAIMKRGYNVFTITCYSSLVVALTLIPVTDWDVILDFAVEAPVENISLILMHAVITAVLPYTLYTVSFAYIDTGKASILAAGGEPSAAMVFGFIFFAERLTLLSVIGLIITIGALIVISKPEKER